MRRTLLAVLALSALPLTVAAQDDTVAALRTPAAANRTGFFIGFDPVAYATLTSDAVTGGVRRGGTGIALRLGWGFTERLAIVFDTPVTDLRVADSADYLLATSDLALQYRFATRRVGKRALVPSVQVGVGLPSVDATFYGGPAPLDYTLSGESLAIGAGIAFYLRPSLATTLHAWWGQVAFNDERIGNTTTHGRGIKATSSRVQAGVEWHRGRKAP